MTPPSPPTRQPTQARAKTTRQALLRAALQCFANEHYAAVGVRDIAALVGVNAAMINRYFNSKEQLMAEVIAEYGARHSLLHAIEGPLDELGLRLSRTFLDPPSDEARDYYKATLQGFSSAEPLPASLNSSRQTFVQAVAARLSGPDALLRAEVIRAVLIGGANVTLFQSAGHPQAQQLQAFVERIGRTIQGHIDDLN